MGLPLIEAVKLASLNPSRVLGLTGRLGRLAGGMDASLTVIDEDLNVYWTMVQGRTVCQNLRGRQESLVQVASGDFQVACAVNGHCETAAERKSPMGEAPDRTNR